VDETLNFHQRATATTEPLLEEARRFLLAGELKKAFRSVENLLWSGGHVLSSPVIENARGLAQEIAEQSSGRLQRRAQQLDAVLKERSDRLEYTAKQTAYQARLRRLELNTVAFAVLTSSDPEEESAAALGRLSFEVLTPKVRDWSPSLDACYLAGYKPVATLGRVSIREVEVVRTSQLLRETVNEVVLEHAAFVENISDLRQAVPGCVGFAMVRDDLRVRELISMLQRHSGTTVELPSDAAMTTAFLDAMEAASTAPEERDLFKFIASAAFYVGAGAGFEDVVTWSTAPSGTPQ
jgi:hypothetical protein